MPAPPNRDYYEVLGVPRDADPDAIKKAFRALAMKYHPDKNPGDATAEAKFKEIGEAYGVLGDADRRAQYDRFGRVTSGPGGVGGGPGPSDVVDLSAMFETVLGDMLGSLGGMSAKRGVGRDIAMEVEVSLVEAAKGVERMVEYERAAPCDACSGRGAEPGTPMESCAACGGRGEVRFQQGFFRMARACERCAGRGSVPKTPCVACKGQGVQRKNEKLAVTIPAGVEDGATRVVRGYGDVGRGGTGDLTLHIRVAAHPLFTRVGNDLHCTVPVSFPQAALGAKIDVPTLEGRDTLRLPPGTQHGAQLRMKGKGMPRFGGYGAGDQLVTVHVEVPTSLSDEQKALVEKLHGAMNDDAHPAQKGFLDKLRELFD